MKLKKIVDFDKKMQKSLRNLLYARKIKPYEINGYRAIDFDEYKNYKSTTKNGRPLK